MSNAQMKTLTIDGNTYEVVDGFVRNKIDSLNSKIDSINNKINSINNEVNSLKQGNDSFDTEVDSINGEINSLKQIDESLSNDVETLNNKIGVLNDDIDSLKRVGTSLNSEIDSLNSEVGSLNSEVEDICTAYDGATYDTAGNAIRTQFIENNVRFVNLESEVSVGEYQKKIFWERGTIDGSDGRELKDDTRYRTDYIRIFGGTLNLTIADGTQAWVYEFDNDYNFVKYANDTWILSDWQFTVENPYIRIVVAKIDLTNMALSDVAGMSLQEHSDKDNMIVFGNYYDEKRATINTYYDYSSGVLKSEQAGYVTSDYIEIPQSYSGINTRYIMAYSKDSTNNTWGANARAICWFDSNRQLIKYWGHNDKISDNEGNVVYGTISVSENPNDAKFVRVTFYTDDTQLFIGFQNNTNEPSYSPFETKICGSMIPDLASTINNTDGAVTALIRTALEYVNNSEFGYGCNHTAFDDVCGGKYASVNESGDNTYYTGEKYQIDCSSFATLCLQGITFKSSRYLSTNTENIIAPNAYKFNDLAVYETFIATGEYEGKHNRIYANALAKYAYNNGFLYSVKQDFSNIEVGDLLFWSNCNKWENLEFWEDIGHVAIVTDKYKLSTNGMYRIKIMEGTYKNSSYGAVQSIVDAGNEYIKYAARYPLKDAYMDKSNICEAFDETTTNITSGEGSIVLKTLTLQKPLKAPGVYTLAFKAEIPDDSYFEYAVNNYANGYSDLVGSSGNNLEKRPDGFQVVHIHLPMSMELNTTYAKQLQIRVNANGGTGTATIYDAKVINGYATVSPLEFD